jgi:subtilisin family serine protease
MDRVLVRLKNESQYSFFENEMKKNVYVLNYERNEFEPLLMEVKVVGNKNALEIANELQETQNYAYAEPDFLRLMERMNTNDPSVDDQWSLNNDGVNTSSWGGTVGADMKVYDAWGSTTGSASIKVAILDEGVDLNHPDLAGNMLGGYDATGQGSGGGPSGDDAHGTACAGIVAAVGNNNTGGAGVAYSSKIVPVRIAYSSGPNWVTSNTWIGNALNWSWNQGNADILSNSWGGGGSSSVINGAIDNAINNGRGGLGSPVLFAAGNDNGANSYPATYAPTISVIAMSMCNQRKSPSSCDGETWWGSNYGTGADIAAPGVKIFATDISGSAGYSSGDYTSTFNGTSSATPNAAGVMALVLSANGSLTEDQARAALESTTDKVGGYSYSNTGGQPNGTWSNDLGYGRVNAEAAVASVSSSTADDAGITSITAPNGSICATSETPVVVLRNYGSNTLSSVTINYSLDGGSNSTYNWTGSLAQNGTANVSLPSISFAGGNHTFAASTSNPNGQADENTANDDASSSFSSGSNNVTLSITFDNYPEETSWDIKDSGGATVASGGTYGSQADGSTLAIPLCLADGCFDFTIYDAYGDGICCAYGNGSYTLTEDASGTVLANGGSFTSSETTNFCVPVSPSSNVQVLISSSTNVSCNGGSDGSATASATGGTSAITYSWSGNGGSGATASGLGAGTYNVTATDGTTSSSVSVTITEPLAVSVSVSGTNATGGNDNGSATATAGGGTPGFSYSWSNGATGPTTSGLAAGTYVVTAYDSRGCSGVGSVTISQTGGTPVNVSISSSTNVSCNGGSDGAATASATGGNGSYSYLWSNSASGATASGLAAGTYNVTVTSGTATATVSVTITEPTILGGTINGTNPTAANNDGSATVSPTGGTPGSGYIYLWSNGGTTATINGLSAGTYGVTVTDANGCEASGSITLELPGGCTYQTINSNGFESGWGIWNDGGSDCRRSANDNQYATTGTYCVRIRDNTSTSTTTTDNLDLSSYEEVTVDFAYYARSMENGEDFWLQVSTNGGSSYTTVGDWNRGVEFQNNTFNTAQVVITGTFTSTTRFRFRCDASGNSDWIYLDDIVITGCTTSPSSSSPGINSDPEVLVDKDIEEIEEVEKTIQELNLYPNPTNNILNVVFETTNTTDVKMVVMSLTGQMIEMRDLKLEEGTQQLKIDVNRFGNGIYFIHLITKEERISKKFTVVN